MTKKRVGVGGNKGALARKCNPKLAKIQRENDLREVARVEPPPEECVAG